MDPYYCPCCLPLPSDLFLPKQAAEDALKSDENECNDNNEADMLSPQSAWQELVVDTSCSIINIIDTHNHAHLNRKHTNRDGTDSAYYELPQTDQQRFRFVSLTCAVHTDDWDACIAHGQASPYRMTALGLHPWYLNDIAVNDESSNGDDRYWSSRLETILQQHSRIAIGEIGLCKMARFVRSYPKGKTAALQLQRQVMSIQLELAATYQRPVSLHCVNQQSVLLDTLKACDKLPPAIALHSFSGTAHQVQQLLKWEKETRVASVAATKLYFGFSHAINCAMSTSEKSRRQGREAIKAVPLDRLLAESDLHSEADVLGGTVAAIAYIAWALQKPVVAIAEITSANAVQYLNMFTTDTSFDK